MVVNRIHLWEYEKANDLVDNKAVASIQRSGRAAPAIYQRLFEVLLVVGVVVFGHIVFGFEIGEGVKPASTIGHGAVLLAGLAIAFRRWNPALVLVVVAIARVVGTVDTGSEFAIAPAFAIAMYAVGRKGDRSTAIKVSLSVALLSAAAIAGLEDETFLLELIAETAQFLLPAVIGDAVRARAERLNELIETEAAARVQAERLRIARDLHDVVAHGLSTIAVQSGVAAHLMDQDPDEAKASLQIINETGKASLEELRTMVGVLRSTDDSPLRPAPTEPDAFPDLLAGAEAAGVEITDRSTGQFPAEVGDGIIVAVHRIVQEALTNVVRHAGSVAATVEVVRGEDSVTISVRNNEGNSQPTAVGSAVPSTGVGLIGMRERAESFGGTFTAGAMPGGGYEVTAVIPYRETR